MQREHRFRMALAALWFGAMAVATVPAAADEASAPGDKPASQLLIAPKAASEAAPAVTEGVKDSSAGTQGAREPLPAPAAAPAEPETSATLPGGSASSEELSGPTPLPPALPTPAPRAPAQPLTQGAAQGETAVQGARLSEPAEAPPAAPVISTPEIGSATDEAAVPTRLPEPLLTPEPAEPAQPESAGKNADRLTEPSAPPPPPNLDEILVEPRTSASQPGDPEVSGPEVSASESAAVATGSPGAAARPIVSILFQPGSAELSDSGKSALTSLATRLQDTARIELLAFAAGDGKSTSKPKRLSLSRAQIVCGYLTEQGIPATSMTIRALGDSAKAGPPDRVDIRAQGG
jgi:outer membrane protein OmpA-like peptidoglycan-associated protein